MSREGNGPLKHGRCILLDGIANSATSSAYYTHDNECATESLGTSTQPRQSISSSAYYTHDNKCATEWLDTMAQPRQSITFVPGLGCLLRCREDAEHSACGHRPFVWWGSRSPLSKELIAHTCPGLWSFSSNDACNCPPACTHLSAELPGLLILALHVTRQFFPLVSLETPRNGLVLTRLSTCALRGRQASVQRVQRLFRDSSLLRKRLRNRTSSTHRLTSNPWLVNLASTYQVH